MPRSVLYRFDETIYRDNSPTDATQVPFAGATVQFYRQGSSTSNSSPSSIPTGSSTLAVSDPGDLADGDTVSVGADGAIITVTTVDSTTQLTVNNATGSSITLPARSRLLITSNRPVVYSDPLGAVSAGSSIVANSDGRVAAYVDTPRFDYAVEGVATFDSTTSSTINAGFSATWSHTTVNAAHRILVVAISWTGIAGGEAISSVTYNSVALTALASTDFLDLYYLIDPPVGTYTVSVQFGATDAVYAVLGAVSAYSVKPIAPSTVSNSSVTGASASATLTSTRVPSLLLAALGIGSQTAVATVMPGQTVLWNLSLGSSPNRTNGAGERTAGTGSNVAMGFTWSGNRQWGMIAAELTPAQLRLYVDVTGVAEPTPAWLNAQSFESIQDAIDALPDFGGVVYVPSGRYVITDTIIIPTNKHVHLLGDGPYATIIYCDSEDTDLLWIQGDYSTIDSLAIQGPNAAGSGRGIVIGILGEEAAVMRRVAIINCRVLETGGWALYCLDKEDSGGVAEATLSIWGYYERNAFRNALTGGLVRLGRDTNIHTFVSCDFTFFRGLAVSAINASALNFVSCGFEERFDVPLPGDFDPPLTPTQFPYVELDGCNNVAMSGCWFETHDPNDKYYTFISVGRTLPCLDVSINSCRFVREHGGFPRIVYAANDSSVSVINATCHCKDELDEDRFDPNAPENQDIGSAPPLSDTTAPEILVAGGGITSPGGGDLYFAITSGPGIALAAVGPRLTPPSCRDLLRDSATSLGGDKKSGDTIFNTDTGRLQSWTGSDWLPAKVNAGGGTGTTTGTLINGSGTYRVSAYASLSSSASGNVSVSVSWTSTVTRTVTLITSFSTAGGHINADAFVDVIGPVTYSVVATGFIVGSFGAVLVAEAV